MRIQTVYRDTNSRLYSLLEAFESLTGYPLLVNTSFNVRGEPIVCSPEDAYRCFMRSPRRLKRRCHVGLLLDCSVEKLENLQGRFFRQH